ncbi:MAG: hypothetical protein MHM6MM_003790 [Cercozoa sp. M6MM]
MLLWLFLSSLSAVLAAPKLAAAVDVTSKTRADVTMRVTPGADPANALDACTLALDCPTGGLTTRVVTPDNYPDVLALFSDVHTAQTCQMSAYCYNYENPDYHTDTVTESLVVGHRAGEVRDVQVEVYTAGTFFVSWKAPLRDGGFPIQGYTVKWGTAVTPQQVLTFLPNETYAELPYPEKDENDYYIYVTADNEVGEGEIVMDYASHKYRSEAAYETPDFSVDWIESDSPAEETADSEATTLVAAVSWDWHQAYDSARIESYNMKGQLLSGNTIKREPAETKRTFTVALRSDADYIVKMRLQASTNNAVTFNTKWKQRVLSSYEEFDVHIVNIFGVLLVSIGFVSGALASTIVWHTSRCRRKCAGVDDVDSDCDSGSASPPEPSRDVHLV